MTLFGEVLDAEAAVDVEIVPQLASLNSPEFTARLTNIRARIGGK